MKYTFKQTYTFPVTVASAVVAYLDCEHYTFLHKSCEKRYKTISLTGNKCISEILYKSGIFSWKQKSTTEYIGLAELKQYDISIYGFGPAIIANFFNVSTSLRYFENNEDRMVEDIEDDFKLKRIDKNDNTVLSEITYNLDIPFFLWPFKSLIRNKLELMKRSKDLEDLYMIKKRIKIFGSDYPLSENSPYWRPYFKKSYFLLFKETFINNFF